MAQDMLKGAIKEAIRLIFFQKFEVPVLGMFHKEALGELLCGREPETPQVLTVWPIIPHVILTLHSLSLSPIA
jgi:hypothetical protein